MTIDKYKTEFAQWLYLRSELPKNVIELSETHVELIADIIDAFCVREEINTSWVQLDVSGMLVIVMRAPADRDTLELRHWWRRAWAVHGMDAPVLDIDAVDEDDREE